VEWVLSDMETAGRAGGKGPMFTAAVIVAIVVILGLLVWRVVSG
jgi:hypothetical protein